MFIKANVQVKIVLKPENIEALQDIIEIQIPEDLDAEELHEILEDLTQSYVSTTLSK